MKPHERWAIYPLLLFSLLASVIAICRTCPRAELGFDYIGLIVGILALLVTMLIGWQIYNALSLEQKVSNIKKEYDGLKDKSEALAQQQENIKVYNEASMEFIQGITMVSNYNSTNLAQAYSLFASALLHYIEADIDLEANADRCLREMLVALTLDINRWRYGDVREKIDKTISEILEKKGLSCSLTVRLFNIEKERENMRLL